MGRAAERVYTDPASIRRLESLIGELPANGHVVLLLKDGSSCDGVVVTRPNVQMFRDADEREGINATVKLERPDVPAWSRQVWLDQIARVEHVDSIMASEN
ncbi:MULTISPECIES: DUF3247 family protein [Rhodanobacter]|uniref:DUF3247 family protein n=1 Tax=Rhodanobacter TaxID=75309 RepID=UPI000260D0AD|nr:MULTISPECIES: DUF3247 family protein [Rhodanobacter]EIM03735.1 hypothetical protein UUC_06587 [Rhodanobacter denitrificans]KZC21147.1 hypothetical protein RHOFW104R3_03085 [Rhodanobacter denitrificans]UJJ50628.1 DUF3247 family protein [Rhodanobacter denitrificans]UJM91044.1 DUF3247 family protein [Rhodanobacter denitrificans]UJM93343.1 DUF3247 family protein [Rhodanobacter denitrificans]